MVCSGEGKMNRIFGKRTAAPKITLDDAVKGLDERVASLDVKLAKLNAELSAYQQKLTGMRDGPAKNSVKQRALKVLRQRKLIESQRDQLQTQSWNMEQASITSENLRNTIVTIDAMKRANKELKRQYGKINIDKIDAMQAEMADLLDVNEELQETMARNYAVPDDIDEEELDAELEALGEELDFEAANAESGVPSYLEEEGLPEIVDEHQAAAADSSKEKVFTT